MTKNTEDITIRHVAEGDRTALERLAQLDSTEAPGGDALLAFVGSDLRAALPERGEPFADPFHRTAEILDLLRLRHDQEGAGRAAWRG